MVIIAKEIQGFSFDRLCPGLARLGWIWADLDSAWIGLGLILPLEISIIRGGGAAHCAPRRERLYPADPRAVRLARGLRRWALSSAVEHYLDMVGVRGSIPLAPTISRSAASFLRPFSAIGAIGAAAVASQPIDGFASLSLWTTAFADAKRSKGDRALLRILAGLPSSSPAPTLRRPRPSPRARSRTSTATG